MYFKLHKDKDLVFTETAQVSKTAHSRWSIIMNTWMNEATQGHGKWMAQCFLSGPAMGQAMPSETSCDGPGAAQALTETICVTLVYADPPAVGLTQIMRFQVRYCCLRFPFSLLALCQSHPWMRVLGKVISLPRSVPPSAVPTISETLGGLDIILQALHIITLGNLGWDCGFSLMAEGAACSHREVMRKVFSGLGLLLACLFIWGSDKSGFNLKLPHPDSSMILAVCPSVLSLSFLPWKIGLVIPSSEVYWEELDHSAYHLTHRKCSQNSSCH